ncbi:hypothetical protein QAD02_014137 [Eretmocerus hayati]|uniref:Uncharacterized protein n=1 Tax=Eretmocerus hayati TaxID=131215 RepID=A0ACC2P4P1_9HYME|nr:hypothetical protein QAD02_014137 [Eretmocerus hayati]
MFDLPQGWETLDMPQQLGLLFKAIQSQSTNFTEGLSHLDKKFDTFTDVLKQQSEKINLLEKGNLFLREEISQLKTLQAGGQPSSELRVTGIPSNCSLHLEDFPKKILECLHAAESLKNDILGVREFKPKILNSADVSLSTSNSERSGGENRSLVIKFKSSNIRDHVLKLKRDFGELKLSDSISNGSKQARIGIYEMLPPIVHKLRVLTQERVHQYGYKHVWTRKGNIYVRKDH